MRLTRPSSAHGDEFSPLPIGVVTPINVDILETYLTSHPDRDQVNYILQGFRNGFDIGFQGPISNTRPRNLRSADENSRAVSEAIAKEIHRTHTSGPFSSPPFEPFHCSPLGAVPKKDGTFRIILDLSSPRGYSINDGISREDFSVRYTSFDEATYLVRQLGPDCMMAKLDIKHAFRLCPVRPDQWPLLGYEWQGLFYVDTRLPFGSRSSPLIFNSFADLVLWILIYICGISFIIHYLDDFFLCATSREECSRQMGDISTLFSELGIPLADDKTFGPCDIITYLGIEIDAPNMTIRLPSDKYFELLDLLKVWKKKKKCTKRQLLSLIGSLSFAAKVVKPGRMFLRRLIDLSTTVNKLDHHITLNSESKADIKWWLDFLPSWNGVAIIQHAAITSASISLFTDASRVGFGAVYGDSWISEKWPETFLNFHINVLELFAIVAAVRTWGHEWQDQQIMFYTDNMSITHVWFTGTSVDSIIMKLVRYMFLFAARLNINILMQHVPGVNNNAADALSRSQIGRFHQLRPTAKSQPDVVIPEVWSILTP